MDKLLRYIPFYSQSLLLITGKLEGVIIPWIIIPLRHTPQGSTRALKFSDDWTTWGVPQNYSVSSNNLEEYNLHENSTVVTQFYLKLTFKNKTWVVQDFKIDLVTYIG